MARCFITRASVATVQSGTRALVATVQSGTRASVAIVQSGTRASVATVQSKHPCISSCLWVNSLAYGRCGSNLLIYAFYILRINFLSTSCEIGEGHSALLMTNIEHWYHPSGGLVSSTNRIWARIDTMLLEASGRLWPKSGTLCPAGTYPQLIFAWLIFEWKYNITGLHGTIFFHGCHEDQDLQHYFGLLGHNDLIIINVKHCTYT